MLASRSPIVHTFLLAITVVGEQLRCFGFMKQPFYKTHLKCFSDALRVLEVSLDGNKLGL